MAVMRAEPWLVLCVACGGAASPEPQRPTPTTTQVTATRVEPILNECRKRSDGSFDLTSDEVLLRRGLGDRSFADTATTAVAPIQVCGILGGSGG
jgi:hypothetical protein